MFTPLTYIAISILGNINISLSIINSINISTRKVSAARLLPAPLLLINFRMLKI